MAAADTDDTDMPELSVPLDTVCNLIAMAREFDVKVGSSDPDADPEDADDLDAAVLENRGSDPVEKELRSAIHDLDIDAQIDLVTLMWIGRDDLGAEDWDETREMASQEHNSRTASYLVGTPLLADHLSAGLDALGLDCSGYDDNLV